MSFEPKKQPYSGKINAVTLGTGDKAIVIGGQNVLPFYTFDAPIENAPKIGVEISDLASEWTAPALKEFYAGCTTMADYAKKAETMEGADFLCLHFESADPNGANRSVADCVADAKAVADALAEGGAVHAAHPRDAVETALSWFVDGTLAERSRRALEFASLYTGATQRQMRFVREIWAQETSKMS